MIAPCPPEKKLRSFSLGMLPEEQSDAVYVHLQDCETCQHELSSLETVEDTLVNQLRQANSEQDEFDHEIDCQRAANLALGALGRHQTETGKQEEGLRVPKLIGEYEIVRPLGRGGMGHVFLGRHTKLGRMVAIKIIANHRLWDQTMHDRFAAEMRTIGSLNHPNIVTAYDAREVDGLAVLVTQYIDGLNLSQILERRNRLTVADACKIVVEVCAALEYCHTQGLIHRDIKPSNIMVDQEGHVWLLDLGLARFQGDEQDSEFTKTGQAVGTADYVAPEQIHHSRQVDLRTDIYGLGCTLFKLLTGRAPYSAPEFETTFAKMNAHVSEEIPKPSARIPDLPSAIDNLVEQMLQKSPEQRPQSTSEVVKTLATFSSKSDLAELVRLSLDPDNLATLSLAPQSQSRITNRSRFPNWAKWLAAGFFGLACFALGIVLTIKRPDGKTTQVEIPDGSSAIVDAHGNIEITIEGGKKLTIPQANVENFGNAIDANDKVVVKVPKSSELFSQLESGDQVDVFLNAPNGTEKLVLSGKTARIVSRSDSDLSVALDVLEYERSFLDEVSTSEGVEPQLRFFDQARGMQFDRDQLQGIWKAVLFKMGDRTIQMPQEFVIAFHKGHALNIVDGQVVQTSTYSMDYGNRLRLDDIPESSPLGNVMHYSFTPTGKLQVRTMQPEGSNTLVRLTRVDPKDISTRSEKLAQEIFDNSTQSLTQIEFCLVDEAGKRIGDPVITNVDLVKAKATKSLNEWGISINLTTAAGDRLMKFTTENQSKSLGIFVDGQLINAPKIMSPISSRLMIAGNFNQREAERLAEQIMPHLQLSGEPITMKPGRFLIRKNLRRLAIAMHNYESSEKSFPNERFKLERGKVVKRKHPVSWRVLILPYLGYQELYQTYNQDEPWDSESNQRLLEMIPSELSDPNVAGSTKTPFMAFEGADTLINAKRPIGFKDIRDGTANTLMFLHSPNAQPWTLPGGLDISSNDLKKLTGQEGTTPVVLVDGSVSEIVWEEISETELLNFICISDGNVSRLNFLKHNVDKKKSSNFRDQFDPGARRNVPETGPEAPIRAEQRTENPTTFQRAEDAEYKKR